MMDMGSLLRMHGMRPEQLGQMQAVTSRIRASIHTEEGEVSIRLFTEDAEAAEALPQVVEGIVSSVANSLYQIFAIQGERV